ncbi:hypothetical protein AAE478_009517 [Parahypoxylon ruwenzoriense]
MKQLGNHHMVSSMVHFTIVNSIFFFLALAMVAMRLYSRIYTKAGFGWDDGFIVLSMALAISLMAVEVLLCKSGIGHPVAILDSNIPLLIQLITIHHILFVATVLARRLSVLCFYLRVFSRNPSVRKAAQFIIVFFLLWAATSIIGLLAICRPHAADEDKCDRAAIMDNSSAFSVIGDMLVLIIPLPAIWNLHMELRDRIKMTVLFLLGIVVTIIAVARRVTVEKLDFSTSEFAIMSQNPLALAVLESNMGIICASLPTVQILFRDWKDKLLRCNTATDEHQRKTPDRGSNEAPDEPFSVQLERGGCQYVVPDSAAKPPLHLSPNIYTQRMSIQLRGQEIVEGEK